MAIDASKISNLDRSLGIPGMKPGADALGAGPSFQETLSGLNKANDSKTNSLPAESKLKFSNHAIDRMRSRGLSFSPEQMSKLETAVKKAAEKGGRDSLVLMNDAAVIVSVKNNTVVTVVDKASLKENVFTNIDSTIVI